MTVTKKTCTRCNGTRKYSWNQIDGNVCYGCDGKGFNYKVNNGKGFKLVEILPGDVMLRGREVFRVISKDKAIFRIAYLGRLKMYDHPHFEWGHVCIFANIGVSAVKKAIPFSQVTDF